MSEKERNGQESTESTDPTEQRQKFERRRRERLHRKSMQYGIDLRKIHEDDLTVGEKDIVAVYRADLHDDEDPQRPAPKTIGLMHEIQQRYGDSTVVEIEDFSISGIESV